MNKKIHYAWIVMIGCALTQIGSLGAVVYTIGVFYAPVAEALGVGRGDVVLSQTVLALVQAFSLPFVGKFVSKRKLNVAMGISAIGFAGGFALLSVFHSIWLWYAAAAVMGFCGAFLCFLPVPILINNWFHRKSGLALGIATATGGLGGAVLTPVAANLIVQLGWRQTLVILGCVSAVFIMVPSFLLIRNKPSDMGLKPYGAEDEGAFAAAAPAGGAAELPGVPYDTARRSRNYYCLFVACALLGTVAVYATHMVGYAQTLGYAATISATISSLTMVGTLVCKLGLGALKDRFGTKAVVFGGTGLVAVMMVATGMLGRIPPVLYAGAFIAGLGAALGSLSPAWITRMAFGSKDYARILSNNTMAYTLFMGVYTAMVGYIFDYTGSYTPAFLISAGCAVAAILLIGAAISKKNSLLKAEVQTAV